MTPYSDVSTPAAREATLAASVYGLEQHGLTRLHRVYWNLSEPALYEEAIFRREGKLSFMGPLVVNTGKHTARAAADKFIVREHTTEDRVWWGEYNRPFSPQNFNALRARLQGYLQG